MRFAPDMMGSGVCQGVLDVEAMLGSADDDGTTVAQSLSRIGYAGDTPAGRFRSRTDFSDVPDYIVLSSALTGVDAAIIVVPATGSP